MIQNFIGSGGSEALNASVTLGSAGTTLTFENIPAEPKSWALMLYASNGVGTGSLTSTKYMVGYLHGGEYDYGETIFNSGMALASTVETAYDAGDQEFTITAKGGNQFISGEGMSYRLIYTI